MKSDRLIIIGASPKGGKTEAIKQMHEQLVEGTMRDGMTWREVPERGRVYEVADPSPSKLWAGADDSWRGKLRSAWARFKHWLNDQVSQNRGAKGVASE